MDCLYERVGTDVHGCTCTYIPSPGEAVSFLYHDAYWFESESLPGTPVCILLAVFIPYIAWVTGVPGVCYLGARIQLCSLEQAFNN